MSPCLTQGHWGHQQQSPICLPYPILSPSFPTPVATMTKRPIILLVISQLATLAFADHPSTSDCCEFTISSTVGNFDCPAGELLDGQIRLNGTYDTSTFCISPAGGITNARGFGCIVTDAPTTQFQCDEGKPPTLGFSIGDNNTLLYEGSSRFHVCPATDTEYNIYVSPDFGQTKCFPVVLQTDGCGAKKTCPPPPERETVWKTEWATSTVQYKITETWTSLVPCSTSAAPTTAPANMTKPCMKKDCHQSSPIWTNDTLTAPVPPTGATGTSGTLLPPTGGVNLPDAGPVGGTETEIRALPTRGPVARRQWWGR